MEKGEFGEKEELLQRLSRAELECTKLSEEVVRLRDADRRCQVGHIEGRGGIQWRANSKTFHFQICIKM